MYEYKQVPKEALNFNCPADCEFTSNGEGAKTAKFEMVARTGDPINHHFWGKLIHDNDGCSLHKNRVKIDYNHKETIGFANKINVENGDLKAKGVIQSVKSGDRAEEVILRGQAGQPYEASIAHDQNIVLEEVKEGFTATANGRDVEGPALIVREWNLRGIAVCDNGYDMNTITEFTDDSETVEVKFFTHNDNENDPNIEVLEMQNENEVEAVELAVEAEVEDKVEAQEAVETVEEVETEEAVVEAVEGVTEEANEQQEVEVVDEVVEPVEEVEVEEVAVEAVEETETELKVETVDFSIHQATLDELAQLKQEHEELQGRLEALGSMGEENPVSFVAEVPKEQQAFDAKLNEFSKVTNDAIAAYAAGTKFPPK
jgi:hypothetical protein